MQKGDGGQMAWKNEMIEQIKQDPSHRFRSSRAGLRRQGGGIGWKW